MFGKKKKASEEAQNQTAVETSAAESTSTGAEPAKKRKKKEMVSSVIKESVLEKIMEEFQANKQFVSHTEDGEVAYVGLLLKTDDIGGLSLKTNKDEAKGSIVENINSGRIKVYASKELLDNESFVIIPDALTVDAMQEFGILDIEYDLVKVTEDGAVHPVNATITLKEVANILADDSIMIDDLLDSGEEDAVEETEEVPDEEIPEEEETIPEEEPEPVPTPVEETPVFDEEEPVPEYDESVPDEEIPEEPDEVPAEEEPQEEDTVFSQKDLTEAITRRFYSDDLGLEVTTEPFDQQFIHNNLFVPFAENRDAGWLNNYLNDMSKQANQELYRMHQQNLVQLRNDYFTMVSLGAQEIVADCDYTSSATTFGETAQLYEDAKEEALSNISDTIAMEKDRINGEWDEKLEAIGEAAAANAKQQYRERFGRQHEDEIYHIEPNIRDRIESEYNENMRKLHEDRKATAQKKLDAFIHEALQKSAEQRIKMLEAENVRYKEWQATMQQFVDENRKDEIARSQALAEELAQSKKADAVLAEQTEKLRNISAEFDNKKRELLHELDAAEQRRKTELAELQKKHEDYVAELKNRNKMLQEQFDNLMKDYTMLDERKRQENEARINELKNEVASWSDKCDHIVQVHKHSNIISGFLAMAAVIAAIAIGFVAGEYVNVTGSKVNTQSEIITEFNNAMDKVGADAAANADAPAATNVAE